MDNSYVACILRLTLLAPDLIEAVLAVTEPDGLSLEKLYRVPVEWEEQRRVLVVERGSQVPVGAGAAQGPRAGTNVFVSSG